jgi:hypothetical protein
MNLIKLRCKCGMFRIDQEDRKLLHVCAWCATEANIPVIKKEGEE